MIDLDQISYFINNYRGTFHIAYCYQGHWIQFKDVDLEKCLLIANTATYLKRQVRIKNKSHVTVINSFEGLEKFIEELRS